MNRKNAGLQPEPFITPFTHRCENPARPLLIPYLHKLVIFAALFCLVACGRGSVDLPDGYTLRDRGKILLRDPKGVVISSDEITQFMVSGPHVYGWINNKAEEFFVLNTSSGKFEVFPSWDALNRHTDKLSLPRLNMGNSYTYWDIRSGHRRL